jgi:DNA-binding MarR family transcriptional regulator
MAIVARMPRARAARPGDRPRPSRAAASDAGDALVLGVLNDVMGFRLRRIQNHLAKAFVDHPRHGDLKPGLFSILALIAANPGVSQSRLAHEAGIDKTILVSLLDDLEEAGWAVRVRSREDRRKHSLLITAEGKEALQELTQAAREAEAKARSALTGKELEQLFQVLDKLYARCFREEEI